MTEKPTYGPQWATDNDIVAPGSDPSLNPVIAPTSAKRATGFGVEPLPYQTVNALHAESGQWLAYLVSRTDIFESLQAYIASSNVAADPGNNGTLYPGLVRGAAVPPGTETLHTSLGNLTTEAAHMKLSADGRFVCVSTSPDNVRIITPSDMIFQTTAAPASGVSARISAIASDGFGLFAAYDGVIERFELPDGNGDSAWGPAANVGAFAGKWAHGADINSMLCVGPRLFFGGAAAPSTQNTPTGHNLVRLELDGETAGAASAAVLSGEITHLDYFNGEVLVADVAGNVGLYDEDLNEIWSVDFSEWDTIQDIALGSDVVVVAGAVTGSSDVSVRAYHKRFGQSSTIGSPIGQVDFDGAAWTVCAAMVDGDVIVAAHDGTNSTIGVYTLATAGARTVMRARTDSNAISIGSAVNVRSISKTGTGVYEIPVPTELADQVGAGGLSANFLVTPDSPSNADQSAQVGYSAGLFTVRTFNQAGAPADCGFSFEASWGDSALAPKWVKTLSSAKVIDLASDGDAVYVATDEATEFVRKLSLGRLMSTWMVGDRITDRVKGAARRIS